MCTCCGSCYIVVVGVILLWQVLYCCGRCYIVVVGVILLW